MSSSSTPPKPLHWTRRVRSVISSIADIVGDWFYFFYIWNLNDDRVDVDIYGNILFVCCVISSIVGFISIMTVGCGRTKFCCGGKTSTSELSIINCGCFILTPSKFWHLLEVILEDIPQVLVAAYISYLLKGFSPRAVFNLTTSGMNFFLDFLDIFEPHDGNNNETDNDNKIDTKGTSDTGSPQQRDPEDGNYSARAY